VSSRHFSDNRHYIHSNDFNVHTHYSFNNFLNPFNYAHDVNVNHNFGSTNDPLDNVYSYCSDYSTDRDHDWRECGDGHSDLD
jgi:hypothetical protein